MSRVVDFLTRKYMKKAQSEEALTNTAYNHAAAFRNDPRLTTHREYLLKHYGIDQEDLDLRYAGEMVRHQMGDNWHVSSEDVFNAAKSNNLDYEFIQLAHNYYPGLALLAVHLKLLDEIKIHGHVYDYKKLIRELEVGINEEKKEDTFDPEWIFETLQLSRDKRISRYEENNTSLVNQFFVETQLLAISDSNNEQFEGHIERYDTLRKSLESKGDSISTKLDLVNYVVTLLDHSKSMKYDVNLMVLGVWLYGEHEQEVVALVINLMLARSLYMEKTEEEQFLQKFLIKALNSGEFWNRGAVYGAILASADRRLINQFYANINLITEDELPSMLNCIEQTTSAPTIDFLVDFAMHLYKLNRIKCCYSTLQSLTKIEKNLTGKDITDGTFQIKDEWDEESNNEISGAKISFDEYFSKYSQTFNDLMSEIRN
jgi:hypothetical protein